MGLARDKLTGRPYVRVLLTPELEKQLEAWKTKTGSSHSDTIRTAIREYMIDRIKVEDLGESSPDDEKTEELLVAISKRYRTLLDRLRTSQGGDFRKVIEALEADITGQANAFMAVEMPASISSVVKILLADDATPTDLKDYAKMVLNPPSRDRQKKDNGLGKSIFSRK